MIATAILALDSALGGCGAGVFVAGRPAVARHETMERGQAARLPLLVRQVLDEAMCVPGLVAVTVGPGSFTGIRAALAVAHGLAAGWRCAIVGVRVDEALAHGLEGETWVAIRSRAGRVFLAHDGRLGSYGLATLPRVAGRPMLLGNAADEVEQQLGASFVRVDRAMPALAAVAAIGLARRQGLLSPLPAQPLYLDAPAVTVPAT